MAKVKKSQSVPKAMQEKFDRIVAITDDFSKAYLNDEYAQLIRLATAALCRKRPSPLAKGRDRTWACGITHAIGMVNFLFDRSQDPHISAKELYSAFGVGASTGQAKSKLVRDLLRMSQLDPEWSLPSRIDSNPLVWMLEVNGFIVDIRSAPREVQEIAFAKGLIPYIPGEGDERRNEVAPDTPEENLDDEGGAANRTLPSEKALYTLQVHLLGGPVTEAFAKQNPFIHRTIEIKAGHTLADLHEAIFEAFDREEEHLYEFQIGGTRSDDPKAKRYGPAVAAGGFEGFAFQDAAETTLASLGLAEEDVFGYHFDFGDDWWHQVNVIGLRNRAPKGKYPKVTARVGASPPQYADYEDE